MTQLQTWLGNAGHFLWGKQDESLGGEQTSGNYRGRTIKQIGRGSTLFSAVVGSAFLGLSTLMKSVQGASVDDPIIASSLARRTQAAPAIVAGIPPQSVFPGTLFSHPLLPTDYFSDSDSGGFSFKVLEVGTSSLPAWLKLSVTGVQNIGDYDAYGYDFNELDVKGAYAFAAYGNAGLEIIDLSSLSNPSLVGSYYTPGAANAVHVVGNLAYVADGTSGLQIIDVSNLAAPTLAGSYSTSSWTVGVQVLDNLAYVADGASGLQIIDVSNPAVPSLTGLYDTPGLAIKIHILGDIAYVADGSDGLQIINVTDPSAPTFLGAYNTDEFAYDVHVVGNLAYVADEIGGLKIIDISNPSIPTLRGLYVAPGGSSVGIHVIENYAYVSDNSLALQIIDISNSSAPNIIDSYTASYLNGLHTVGNFIYLAKDHNIEILQTELLLSGIPSQADAGNYELELIAIDPDQNRASSTFIVRVEGPPVVSNSIPTQLADVGVPFNHFIDQTVFPDPNNDVVFYLAKQANQSPLPSWLNFSPIGIFSGTPQSSDTGTYNIQVFARDGIVVAQANTTFPLTVEHFPKVSIPLSNRAAAIDQPYSYTVPIGTFTDQDVGDTLTYSVSTLPSWLNFNPGTRTFSGTPTAGDTGSTLISVSATDTPGATATSTFTLAVGEFPGLLNPIPDQLAAVGVPYLYAIPGNTFTTPPGEFLSYRATKADGSFLPAWLGFVGPRLEFQGTPQPSDKGSVALKILAEDSKGGIAESPFNLNVVDALSQQIARVGGSFVYTIPNDMINSPLGPITYTVTLGDGSPLPTWLNYNPSTNVITGVPPAGSDGTYSILVTADDGVQTPVLGTLSLTVGPNAAPQIANPLSNQVAQVGQTFRLVVADNTFADPNEDSLSLSATRVNGRTLPSWLTFTDRTLEGKPGPGDTGTFSDKTVPLQVCATDGDQEACSVFDLSVQGTSNAERAVSIFGPVVAVAGLAYGWYNKRGLLLNPWNRKNYDKGMKSVAIGEPFSYKLEAPQDQIKIVQAFKGKRMFGGLPAPKALDEKGWLEWLKHDKPIAGSGSLFPSWLTYNGGKNLLDSKEGPQNEDKGIYIIRAYGHGEVILEEVRLNVGDQSEIGTELTTRKRTGNDLSSGMVPLLDDTTTA